MPVRSQTASPASRHARESSEGRMKRAYSWVPRGSRLRTYSAPTMARRNDFALRLRVEKKTIPPRRARRAHASTVLGGSGTCSSISMQVTMS